MAAFAILGVGILCILIGRILLIGAAFRVSVWWGLGIFLPFGPLFFRLSYPEMAPLSRKFRLAGLPCLLVYFMMQPGLPSLPHRFNRPQNSQVPSAPANHYAMEKRSVNLEQRRAASAREFARLNAWSQALKLRKRDLLHSDVEGNRTYNNELQQYTAALSKATAERSALDQLNKPH
jgi:hypothetical protein